MLKRYFVLFICFVCSAVALNSFIGNVQRAEIFELTDNEVTAFKINIPEEEFALLKENAKFVIKIQNADEKLNLFKIVIDNLLSIIESINFNEFYPGYDYNKLLPDLNIDEEGYPQINKEEILNGFDFEPKHYEEVVKNGTDDDVLFAILNSSHDFDLIGIIKTMNSMKLSNEVDEIKRIVIVQLIGGFNKNVLAKRQYISELNGYPDQPILDQPIPDQPIPENNDIANQFTPKEFKTKNATLSVEINGENKNFNKVTFKLAGNSARTFSKPPFNIKIRGGENLYGRVQFKLRPDSADPTLLRTKLVTDFHNRLGLKSTSSNYITLYINDEYMGLYTLNDAYKPHWVEQVYGEKNTTSLYKCDSLIDFDPDWASGCPNDDEDITDNTDLIQFFETIKNAQSASDIEEVFEVDHFLTEMALDYLLGSWDHIQNKISSHNFYLYKQPNGKWIYLSYDFDLDFGFPSLPIDVPFSEFTKQIHIIDILILKDPARFEKILKDVVNKVFNPATLYPYIDKLKNYIKPYIELDKTPDPNGNLPGKLNVEATDFYSLEEWDANSEFTSLSAVVGNVFGLKYWILNQYRYVCDYYKMDCDPIYLDENYSYPINTDVGFSGEEIKIKLKLDNSDTNLDIIPPSIPIPLPISTPIATTTVDTTTEIPTTSLPSNDSNDTNYKCMSELIGYPCCSPKLTKVYSNDEYGDWGYDFSKKEWCGLTPFKDLANEEDCWSEELGYPCCKTCSKVYEVDDSGSWGYEFNKWCGMPSICQN